MAGGFKVKAAAVVLPTEDGSERYLYRSGAVLPTKGFTEAGLKHAAELGLIEKVDTKTETPATPDATPSGTGKQASGDPKVEQPSEKWTLEQLATFAGEHKIDISSAGKKADAVEILTTELAKRAAGTEGQQAQ